MARAWIPTLCVLLFGAPAAAVDLPESVGGLIPSEWSVAFEAPELASDTTWVQAVGGEDLARIVRMSDRVATVVGAESQVVQAEGRSLQAAAGLLPQVSGSASWQTGTPTAAFAALGDSGAMDQYSASAGVTVPLTPWTAIPDQRAARADRLSADQTLIDAQATAALDLVAAYLDVAQARQALAVVEEQLVIEGDLLTVAEARYRGGEVAGVDVLQQRQQVASTRADLPVAKANVGRAERALASLLRLPAEELASTLPSSLPEPALLPLPSPRALVEREPGVQSALRTWESARSSTRSARGSLLPDLSFSASTGVRYTELIDTEIVPTWSAALQATVPLFDGGTTVGRIRSASGAQSQALVDLEQEVVDLVREVEDAIALWEQASAVRLSAREAEAMAEDALRAAQAGYAAGTSTYNTVLTSMQMVRNTRQAALVAQRDHVDAALAVVSLTRAVWVDGELR